jgi:drug/metabolite transporter (DMT)-like permease
MFGAGIVQMSRIVGAVLVAVGALLLIFAYRASNAPLEQVSDALTGRYSEHTMWYLIAGVAAAVGGGLLFVMGGRR